jgi:hypothetical protein
MNRSGSSSSGASIVVGRGTRLMASMKETPCSRRFVRAFAVGARSIGPPACAGSFEPLEPHHQTPHARRLCSVLATGRDGLCSRELGAREGSASAPGRRRVGGGDEDRSGAQEPDRPMSRSRPSLVPTQHTTTFAVMGERHDGGDDGDGNGDERSGGQTSRGRARADRCPCDKADRRGSSYRAEHASPPPAAARR